MSETKLPPSRSAAPPYTVENQRYFDEQYHYKPAPPLTTTSRWYPSRVDPTSEILGAGGNAVVRYAQRNNGDYVAVKEPFRNLHQVDDEIRALQGVKSPHVIKLREVIRAKARDGSLQPYLVTEYLPFRLEKEVRQSLLPHASWRLEEKQVWSILAGVFKGARAIHGAGMVHGDIDMRNILGGADGKAKIADLGSCKPKGKNNPKSTDARAIYRLGAQLFEAAKGENIGEEGLGKDLSPHAQLFLHRAEAVDENPDATPSMFGLGVFIFLGNRLKTQTGLPEKQTNM